MNRPVPSRLSVRVPFSVRKRGAELAAAEKIDRSYLCRVFRLTLLAPEIVEAVLDWRQPEDVTLPALMKGVPVDWREQPAHFAVRRLS